MTESENRSLIEYGKSLGTSDSGDIYLTTPDNEKRLNVRFYAFGNDENPAKVMDSHIVPRRLTRAECKGDTVKDLETSLCHQLCHQDCDPLAGKIIDDSLNYCYNVMFVNSFDVTTLQTQKRQMIIVFVCAKFKMIKKVCNITMTFHRTYMYLKLLQYVTASLAPVTCPWRL